MMRNGKYFREIRESHEDKKGETGRRKKRTLVRDVTVEFIAYTRQPCSSPLSAGILAVNQIRDLRSTRMYINSATTRLSGHPAGGRCLRLDHRQRYTALASKENAVLSWTLSVLSFFLHDTATTLVASLCGLPRDFERISDYGRAASVAAG